MMGIRSSRHDHMASENRRKLAASLSDKVLSDDGRNGDLLRLLLYGCSRVYARIVETRVRRLLNHGGGIQQLPRPVVSVGNLTTGGTGKTPMTAYLASLIQSWGLKPVILSRGYGGSAEGRGVIVSTGQGPRVPAAVAGDEAFGLAQRLPEVPVVVGKNRFAMGIEAARQLAPDCFLLDDGFQHVRLHRDLNLVLLDYRRPFGNGHLLPRGHLREAPSALGRADAVILTRSDLGSPSEPDLSRYCQAKPVFRSRHRSTLAFRWEAGQPGPRVDGGGIPAGTAVFVFSGIADNAAFRNAVRAIGGRLVGFYAFADHHPYSQRDLAKIQVAAKAAGARVIVTTAKDAVRLPRPFDWSQDLLIAEAELVFDTDHFKRYIRGKLVELIGR
jgi:tetraacyldisaccharide 4'-kinase